MAEAIPEPAVTAAERQRLIGEEIAQAHRTLNKILCQGEGFGEKAGPLTEARRLRERLEEWAKGSA